MKRMEATGHERGGRRRVEGEGRDDGRCYREAL